jgi:hypothetical protein
MDLPVLIPDRVVEPGLQDLVKRLKPGDHVEARVVDCLEPHAYIIRVRGYNILSHSKYPFRRFDEVELSVKATEPQLVFELRPIRQAGKRIYV